MTTYKTGNPLGSTAVKDLYDNAENLDVAANSSADTFQDRLGKSRLTWTGIVKAGTGDAGVIVPVVQQAVQDVVDGVDGQVAVAQSAASRAGAARDAAFVNADAYADVATGRAAVADGEQFQVVEGDEIIRYRRDSTSSQTEVARYPSVEGVRSIRNLQLTGLYETSWQVGGIAAIDGAPWNVSNRLRMSELMTPLDGYVSVSVSHPNQVVAIAQWDEEGNYHRVGTQGYAREHKDIRIKGWFNILVRWEDDTDIFTEDNSATVTVATLNEPISNRLEDLKDLLIPPSLYETSWVGGGISIEGSPTTGSNRLRMSELMTPLDGYVSVSVSHPNQEVAIAQWDEEGNYHRVGTQGYAREHKGVRVNGWFNILVRWEDNSDINPEDSSATVTVAPHNKIETHIESISNRLEDIKNLQLTGLYETSWQVGGIAAIDGAPWNVSNRLRMSELMTPLDGYVSVSVSAPGQVVAITQWDEDGNYLRVGTQGYAREHKDIRIKGWFNILVRWEDDTDINPEDNSAIVKLDRYVQTGTDSWDSWVTGIPRFSSLPFGEAISYSLVEKEALFESIMSSYPAEMVKEKIGESFDGAYDINGYSLTPDEFEITVAITCHIHGNEKCNPVGFFALLDAISSPGPKHEFLQWLRRSVRWLVVPFASPVAHENNTRDTNSVNINRNFDWRWDHSTESGKGAAPFSTPEATAIKDFFSPMRHEIDLHLDLHDIPSVSSYSHRPAQSPEFLWQKELEEMRDYLAEINEGLPGPKFNAAHGGGVGYFNHTLGIPSINLEHVAMWWVNKGLNRDQQVAKAAEQTAGFLYLFKHLFSDLRGSAFYRRPFEVAFGSREHGYNGWDSQEVFGAFSLLDGVSESNTFDGVYERASTQSDTTILVISGLQPDDNNSSLTVLRSFERIIENREMYVGHLRNCNLVAAPLFNLADADETALQSEVDTLVAHYAPDYILVVRAGAHNAGASMTSVRVGSEENVTRSTKDSGLEIYTDKVGIENFLPAPYTVFDLGNQVGTAGVYSHCVAEWVKYVLNDMASFYAS